MDGMCHTNTSRHSTHFEQLYLKLWDLHVIEQSMLSASRNFSMRCPQHCLLHTERRCWRVASFHARDCTRCIGCVHDALDENIHVIALGHALCVCLQQRHTASRLASQAHN